MRYATKLQKMLSGPLKMPQIDEAEEAGVTGSADSGYI